MKIIVCFLSVVILAVAWMFADGAHAKWRAAELQEARWNKRGFIGCVNGRLEISNINLGNTGTAVVLHLPEENPCPQTEKAP